MDRKIEPQDIKGELIDTSLYRPSCGELDVSPQWHPVPIYLSAVSRLSQFVEHPDPPALGMALWKRDATIYLWNKNVV